MGMMANVLRGATYQGKGRKNFCPEHIPKVNGMPLSAQVAGCIDLYLPLDKSTTKLAKIGTRVEQD